MIPTPFIPYICQPPADIPITITGSVIQIPIETASFQAIIPFTAQFRNMETKQLMVFSGFHCHLFSLINRDDPLTFL